MKTGGEPAWFRRGLLRLALVCLLFLGACEHKQNANVSASGNSEIYNGGGPLQAMLGEVETQLSQTLTHFKNWGDYSTICQYRGCPPNVSPAVCTAAQVLARVDSAGGLAFAGQCQAYLSDVVPKMVELLSGPDAPVLDVVNASSLAGAEADAARDSSAYTRLGPGGAIHFISDSPELNALCPINPATQVPTCRCEQGICTYAITQLMALLFHELGHKIAFLIASAFVTDDGNYGPFGVAFANLGGGGRQMLNVIGSAIALAWAQGAASAGSPDLGFGGTGVSVAKLRSNAAFGQALARQPDGKLVISGTDGMDWGTIRFHADGKQDLSFNHTGLFSATRMDHVGEATPTTNRSIYVGGVGILPGPTAGQFSIFAGGSGRNTEGPATSFLGMTLQKSDGTPHPAFGPEGQEATYAVRGDRHELITQTAVQPDGKVLFVGYRGVSAGIIPLLARAKPDLNWDLTFNGSGYAAAPADFLPAYWFSVALSQDGDIYTGGYRVQGGKPVPLLARYKSDGTGYAAEFNSGQPVATVLDPECRAAILALAVQPDGKPIAGGHCHKTVGGTTRTRFALWRYQTDGALDISFASGGIFLQSVDDYASSSGELVGWVHDVAVQPDGKILAIGLAQTGTTSAKIVVFRFLPNGSLDRSFGDQGKFTSPRADFTFSVLSSLGYRAILLPDGRLAIVGSVREGNVVKYAVQVLWL